ncbi:cytochrome P450 [Melittangium boletus]|uniref:Cytochrome P450 hydroxylase n=1 Tax=Melittangium boletus DSM 14713 TaxID=1294270 RepID=A0A250IEM9_9BACT|nr:cytochrome P450 [Melittangium boletus]ATB30215.1 cytochrome P450 hydroxylase [Melittangium boletus DSM 14713]
MSLVDRFSFFDPEVMQDPYPYYAELRERAPLLWNAPLQAYIVTRHEDVAHVLKNPALFSSASLRLAGQPIDVVGTILGRPSVPALVNTDPPLHTRMRSIVSRTFTPKRISALEPRVRELSQKLVAEMTAQEEFDFMEGLATPLPVIIIAEMLGIEPARRRDFKRWSDTLISLASAAGPGPEFRRDGQEMHAYMTRIAEERRLAPQEDLISLLVQGGEGQTLSAEEVNAFALLLMLAGNETTTNLLGNAMHALLSHPEQFDWLRKNPSGCGAAIEEALRYESPVVSVMRRTLREVELSGGKVPADSMLMLVLSSANRDPRKFPDPDRFDIQRDAQGVMSFGHGIHFCLGAPLARLEAPTALGELIARAPRLRFAPRQPLRPEYPPSFGVRALKTLWLRRE